MTINFWDTNVYVFRIILFNVIKYHIKMDKIKQLLFLKKPEVKEPQIESNLDLPDDGPVDSPESV